MMKYKVLESYYYTEKHEWAKSDNGEAVVGLTDYAQDKLGEIVFVELPEVGDDVAAGKSAAVVESVKAVSDLYSPLSGTVTEVNEELLDQPELINKEPYGAGWIFKLEVRDEGEFKNLMEKAAYEEFIIKEEEE